MTKYLYQFSTIDLRRMFKKLHDDKDYQRLGSFFWEAFATLPCGYKRNVVKSLYNNLTKKERKLLE